MLSEVPKAKPRNLMPCLSIAGIVQMDLLKLFFLTGVMKADFFWDSGDKLILWKSDTQYKVE